jgi:hypothetical protein
MTKLIEIRFDASLIGQEGIVVKYRNGDKFHSLLYQKGWGYVTVIDLDGAPARNHLDGRYNTSKELSEWDLIMYRESKVMTVEEWIESAPMYPTPFLRSAWRDGASQLAAAIKNGEVDI